MDNDNDNENENLIKKLQHINSIISRLYYDYYLKFNKELYILKNDHFFHCFLCKKKYKYESSIIQHLKKNHNKFFDFVKLLELLLFQIVEFDKKQVSKSDIIFFETILLNLNLYKYRNLLSIRQIFYLD